jgi:23S rRNA pseudouridine2605 synthase
VRLARFLAHGGIASRRDAEGIIASGRVTVGGKVVRDPACGVGEGDEVRVDGSLVEAEPREVWAVNKPAGVVSTAREPGSRPAVVSLVDSAARLYPVGRLDADSTGLLLLTNDGELANRLTHPRYEVQKAYRVQLRRPPAESDLRRLASGVDLDDGMTAPAEVGATASARSRSSCARAATARCAAWQKRSATTWSRCAASASAPSSWATSQRAMHAASPPRRCPGCGRPGSGSDLDDDGPLNQAADSIHAAPRFSGSNHVHCCRWVLMQPEERCCAVMGDNAALAAGKRCCEHPAAFGDLRVSDAEHAAEARVPLL